MKKIILAALFVSAMVCSCNKSEENEIAAPSTDVAQTEGNTVFKFSTSAISVSTRSAEDSYINEQGTESEWKVNKVRIYLFDSATKQFAKTFLLKNLTRTNDGKAGYVTYTSDHVLISQGIYDIFAVANTDVVINAQTVDEFIANVDEDTYKIGQIQDTSNGIMMSNRASSNLSTNIAGYNGNGTDNVIEITLERVVARIDVARSADEYNMKDSQGRTYATVALNDFHYVNLPKSFYTFRHTAILTSMNEPEWTLNSNFGNVADVNGYVIDPYFFKKSVDASYFNNEDAYYVNFFRNYYKGDNVKWTAFKPAAATPVYNTCYSLENCVIQAAQKNGYSTGVVFRGVITPSSVYGLNGAGQLEVVDAADYPSSIYYFNYKFYTSVEALAKAGVTVTEKMDDEELAFADVKRFNMENGKYYTYYTYWVKHLDNNNPLVMGVMEFAVVRNNLYRLLVTNVSDLGPGNPVIDPDTPDEGEAYLKVELNVKPWIVREQTNIVL